MNIYICWILVISACAGIVGFWAYTLEVLQGRVKRSTPWSGLDSYQIWFAVLTLVSISIFLASLVVGAILK